MENTLLWLDDYRDPMQGQWLAFCPIKSGDYEVFWVKSYEEFVEWIKTNGLPTGICFDHDLGDKAIYESSNFTFNYANIGDEKTGYHAAKWLVDYCMDNNLKLPLYNIQSANPVGKENIDSLLKNYLKYVEGK